MNGFNIMVLCPACKGRGQLMAKVNYRNRCVNELRNCPICDGRKKISSDQDAAYARKYAVNQGVKP